MTNDPEFKVKLFGSWTTEIGDLDQAIHIWEYPNYPSYIDTQEKLLKDPEFQSAQQKLRPMLRNRENQIMIEFCPFPSEEPRSDDSIFELRSYVLKPGRVLEWEQHWREGMEARRDLIQPVGAWYSQLGQLNYVHHMWRFPDIQARKEIREKAWEIKGWAQNVYKTIDYIDHMHTRIMRPLGRK